MRESSDRDLNLPKREEAVLRFWKGHDIFAKTLAKTKRGKPFVFYEGPPTANGNPGIHHFEARAFKDIIPRYQTMRGRFVARKAGWDTHGLPVELQVEKELGLKTKRDIERYGIEEFNRKCRESVWRYKEEWDRFTERIAYWVDLQHPYITYEASYIESLWWIIKEFSRKKLFYRDFKVVPWCPRCQTGLSSHELGLGYRTAKDRSVFVRFKIKSDNKRWRNTAIVAWTTTPWTLPGNVALAVNPDEEYVTIPDPEATQQWIVMAKKRFRDFVEESKFPPQYRSSMMLDDIDTYPGKELVGLEYEPLFPVNELQTKTAYRVYPADFVTMEEGTGVVHTAVMYGEDDYRLGKAIGLPTFHTVDETGRFIQTLGEDLAGLFVKAPETEGKIIASLGERGLLWREESHEHEYPFCWRCDTPLIYYARDAWWVKTSVMRKDLVANNETIHWVPDYLKHGRFGEFLREARDWAFSRERYWGTPIPVWICERCDREEVIGGYEELDRLAKKSGNRYWALRHGQAETQLLGIADDDKTTYRLTPRGKKEAEAAAKAIKKLKPDLIVSSPVRRAKETAEIVAQATGAKLVFDDRLWEIRIGELEHKPVAEYHRQFRSTIEKFSKQPPGGESLTDLRARLWGLMRELEEKHRAKRILLVSHEYPIWILWSLGMGLSDEATAAEHDGRKGKFIETGGIVELPFRVLPRDRTGALDPHRPFVDTLELACPQCKKIMRRVPEVCDVWFDSGSMPFAQHHFPFAFENKRKGENSKLLNELPFPADYISEAIDQTRGWFYTLLAVSTFLERGAPYRNVISLGHVLDKNGQKMSKSRGNVVNPWDMIAKYGTDTIRWYFYTINAPGDPKRFDEADLVQKQRGMLALLWNSFVFFDTYADKVPRAVNQDSKPRNVLDRWVMARLDELSADMTARLDQYDVVGAARALEQFVIEDLSRWYLRRSRRRLQRDQHSAEAKEAAAMLGAVLLWTATLAAPFTPLLSEAIYQELRSRLGLKEESVHLRDWPKPTAAKKLSPLISAMAEARALAAAGLAERAKAGIKVRQPLAELKVKTSALGESDRELLELIADEVNVKRVTADPKLNADAALDARITPELRDEGILREIIRNIQELRRDGGLSPRDRIRLQLEGSGAIRDLLKRSEAILKREVGATTVVTSGKRVFDAERDVTSDQGQLWIGIRKIS
ncbi:isoleucine--tRNA ligase [Candidatus Parcubacteria bacterium]|nr:MAG: isoleucine--tRNA ligase [Candidatus Parcubacteria bacterium]